MIIVKCVHRTKQSVTTSQYANSGGREASNNSKTGQASVSMVHSIPELVVTDKVGTRSCLISCYVHPGAVAGGLMICYRHDMV